MPALLAALLLLTFPSTSRTSWMRPDAFRLTIGMSRLDAVRTMRTAGYEMKPGKNLEEMFVDYADDKTLTLHFRNDRLHSVRFELFTFLPDVKKAFDEAKADLAKERGAPKKLPAKTVVVYDNTLPNVMLVMSSDPKSENGKKGIGFVAVRYYDPR